MKWRTNFYSRQPGATSEALARLRAAAPAPLPNSFYALLAFSNGGEWPAGEGQFRFRLSSAEDLVEAFAWEPRRPSAMHNILREFILIGTNGSGLCVGFDTRGQPPWSVIQFDGDADPEERVIEVARDFDEFLDLLGV